jgi:hypothetical protein
MQEWINHVRKQLLILSFSHTVIERKIAKAGHPFPLYQQTYALNADQVCE